MLGYCPNCKEKSVKTKVYGLGKRVEFCLNKGCGYKLDLPPLIQEDFNGTIASGSTTISIR